MTNHPKIVLITGAAVRIGKWIAESMASDGWSVALHCNTNYKAAENLAEKIRGQGGIAEVFRANLACEDDVEKLIPQVVQSMAPISCLINNASTFEYDSSESATRSSWDLHMEVNLRAPFVLSQNFSKISNRTTQGIIINILDQRVWNITPHYMTYTISKYGLWALTQSLALDLAPHIRVNAIGPGPVLPNQRQTNYDFNKQWENTPLKRQISSEEITNTVKYILNTPSLTGQMLAIDSGQHLGWSMPATSELVE
ncbi:MAG: short chain dehydrogenase [Alphaproteobacteria bacterium]|nr:short chain dehydrogenase [Alphaproteobacteria bacterium]|tara:strand:- start:1097 stop:1861 length:765 start_codon:yes stop_codon:yes gene_type:complete